MSAPDCTAQDPLLFFDRHSGLYPLYERLEALLLARFPETRVRVQKTQISFSNRHMYACVSFLRPRKKAELPPSCFTLTLGLPHPLTSARAAAQTEPYPGRWTVHLVLSEMEELDVELFGWLEEAYTFAASKQPRKRQNHM